MKKKPVFIAFSTQKGGVGKTTFTVLTASYLHYACGYNLIVVDCDYPQFSINAMRQRDAQGVDRNPALQELAAAQFSELQKPTYTILCATAEAAVDTVREYLETHEPDTDFVFFDLPGTINNDGVLTTPLRYGLYFHTHLRRPYILGKHAELFSHHQGGDNRQYRHCQQRDLPLLEHGGRQRENTPLCDV